MRASIVFLAPLIALTFASTFAKRDNQSALATGYTVRGFQTFTATPGSTPGNSTVTFAISDNLSNLASCAYISPSTATNAADTSQFRACDNSNFNFLWDGTSLTIFEFYAVSGSSFLAATSTMQPETFCFPEFSPDPLGDGELCETFTGSIFGTFREMTS